MADVPEKNNDAKGGIARLLGRISPRARGILGGIASVLLLSAVIFGFSALSAPKSTPLNTQLGKVSPSDKMYEEALSALASGETTTAISLLEQVVASDPDNQQARRTLESVQSGSATESGADDDDDESAEPDTTDDTPAPATEDPAFGKPTDDLPALLPSSVQGYSLGTKSAVGDDATVSGSPSTPDLIGSRAVWSVHYRKSDKEAAEFVSDVSKSLYSKNPKNVNVDGAKGYFGTDGTRFATVVYVRGRYVFEVVLTSLDGKASALELEAGNAAKAFPDTL